MRRGSNLKDFKNNNNAQSRGKRDLGLFYNLTHFISVFCASMLISVETNTRISNLSRYNSVILHAEVFIFHLSKFQILTSSYPLFMVSGSGSHHCLWCCYIRFDQCIFQHHISKLRFKLDLN